MAMDHPQALPSLDVWTSAMLSKSGAGRGGNGKVEAYGIKKLRELILELAVRGKLVPQDPNDEPASVLLKQIATEKAHLIKAGSIHKENPFPQISEVETPFNIPRGWEFVRLGVITNKIGSGSTPRGGQAAYVDSGIPFLRSQNVWNHGLDMNDVAYISEETNRKMSNTAVRPNDILLNITGASLGRCALYPDEIGEANVSQHVTIIRPTVASTRRYLHYCILSPHTQALVWGRQVGMAREGLSKKVLEQFEIPLPPLAEQHRIVAKVDELMALCDQLEQQQTDSLAAYQTLVETLLGTLTRVESQQEFSAAWARIASHFDTLFTTEASIDQLKQTLLQLAVMGKLVPQAPNDEPVGKVLKLRNEPCKENIPFNIPNSWVWAHVEEFAETRLGKMLDKAKNKGTPVRYLRNINVRWFDFDLSDVKEMLFENSELDEFSLRNGDVLICEGGYPGRAAVWDERESNIYFQKAIHRVRFKMKINPTYFVYVLRESADSGRLNTYFTGAGIQHFTGKGLMSFLVPLPPIAEQDRIVAKIDELMALCDALKARLAAAQTTQIHLADAIVEQAIG